MSANGPGHQKMCEGLQGEHNEVSQTKQKKNNNIFQYRTFLKKANQICTMYTRLS